MNKLRQLELVRTQIMTHPRFHRRSGFTLLEVMLALGLTVVVIAVVTMSVNGTLKLVDHGRAKTERDQLARAILTRIGDDVRSVLRYQPFDASGMMSVSTSSSSKSGGSGGSGSSKSGGGNSGGKSSSGGNSSGGSGSSGTGGSSGSSGSSGGSGSSSDTSSATQSTSSTIAGIYGFEDSLQVDVARLPRADEYVQASTDSAASAAPPSDVRTVSYFLAGSASTSSIPAASGSTLSGTGLARTELDRAMSTYATTQGDTTTSGSNAVILAPEVVALEFQYFDGTSWNTSWDSTANSGLPQAVKISIALSDPAAAATANGSATTSTSISSISDASTQDPDSVYSVVVLVPARDPVQISTSGASSGSSSSGSSSNSSGGTGTGTTSP